MRRPQFFRLFHISFGFIIEIFPFVFTRNFCPHFDEKSIEMRKVAWNKASKPLKKPYCLFFSVVIDANGIKMVSMIPSGKHGFPTVSIIP